VERNGLSTSETNARMNKVFSPLFALKQIYFGVCAISPDDLHATTRNTNYLTSFNPSVKISTGALQEKTSNGSPCFGHVTSTHRGVAPQVFSLSNLIRPARSACASFTNVNSSVHIKIRRRISMNGSKSCSMRYRTDKVQISQRPASRSVKILAL
jgi:hypothetical protein